MYTAEITDTRYLALYTLIYVFGKVHYLFSNLCELSVGSSFISFSGVYLSLFCRPR